MADFFCPAAKLIVEIDGPIHDHQVEQDAARTDYLNALGYRVLRLLNEEVLTNLPAALVCIEQAATAAPPAERYRRAMPKTSDSPQSPHSPPD